MAALLSGLVLGFSAGLAPGPLMALVMAQSLRHGPREGCKVALAPLLTDAPVILLAFWFTARLQEHDRWLGILSLVGGGFVVHLALDAFRSPPTPFSRDDANPQSWFKGAATNLLSPHPWLFWMTVGAATLARAQAVGWPAVAAFLATFYGLLVGSKILLALLAGRSRQWLQGRAYRVVMGFLGGLLLLFAGFLFRQGFLRIG